MRAVLAALLAIAALGGPASAAEHERRPFALDEFEVAVGSYNFGRDHASVGTGLEARFRPFLVRRYARTGIALLPGVGLAGTSRDAILGFAGLRLAWDLGERWRVAPGFALTAYAGHGDINLGGPLEFLSSLAVTRRFRSGVRVGAAFYHLSNGHLYEHNPGANSLALVVAF